MVMVALGMGGGGRGGRGGRGGGVEGEMVTGRSISNFNERPPMTKVKLELCFNQICREIIQ